MLQLVAVAATDHLLEWAANLTLGGLVAVQETLYMRAGLERQRKAMMVAVVLVQVALVAVVALAQ